MTRILNIGSGKRAIEGAVTLDINPNVAPDVVHDLNQFPWPVETDSFDVIYCIEVIEHLRDIVKVMEELHRIGRHGARVVITTPHFSCANSYTDPTHLHHLGFFSFDYFTGESSLDFYTKVRFKKVQARLNFYPRRKNRPIAWLANRYSAFYEEHLAWILPAWYMSFELEVVK